MVWQDYAHTTTLSSPWYSCIDHNKWTALGSTSFPWKDCLSFTLTLFSVNRVNSWREASPPVMTEEPLYNM